ncbi:hypothetical protein ES705_19009 [subsurface metagenome]
MIDELYSEFYYYKTIIYNAITVQNNCNRMRKIQSTSNTTLHLLYEVLYRVSNNP